MSLAGKIKWHVVRSSFRPGEVLVLGSVLEEPDDPESFLIRPSEIDPVPQQDVIDLPNIKKAEIWARMADSNKASAKALFPNSLWSSAGLSCEAGMPETVQTGVGTLNVRAKIFRPPPDSQKEYMTTVLQNPQVTKFVQDCLFTKSLYMIVGVATASNLALKEGEMLGHYMAASADASIPQAGIAMAVSASHERQKALGLKVSLEDDVDFAYVVREFSYSKIRKRVGKGHDWTTGALFGTDHKDVEHYEEEEFVPEFVDFEDDDVDGGETGFTVIC